MSREKRRHLPAALVHTHKHKHKVGLATAYQTPRRFLPPPPPPPPRPPPRLSSLLSPMLGSAPVVTRTCTRSLRRTVPWRRRARNIKIVEVSATNNAILADSRALVSEESELRQDSHCRRWGKKKQRGRGIGRASYGLLSLFGSLK